MDSDPPIEALKAIAHPIRNLILRSLSGDEKNVGEIEDASGVGQPTLSQQLAVLRKSGLVSTRRDGKLVYYALVNAALVSLADHILAMADGEERGKTTVRDQIASVAQFALIG